MRSDTATLSELIAKLRTAGEKPPVWLLDAIRGHGQEAVAPLIDVVNDYPVDDPDEDPYLYYAAHQAIQLLGDLRATEAIAPILRLLDEDDDYIDQYLPESLGKIGAPALEPLRAALFAPDADLYGIARAANALVALAEQYPEHHAEVVRMLLERFEADIPNEEPEALRGFLVSDLADLRAVEAIPAVRRAYGLNRVDETIIGLEHFRALVERPEGVSKYAATVPPGLRQGGSLLADIAPDPVADLDDASPQARPMPVLARKVGRNEPCPCGSGKKYKRCHGR